jgi:hypothetical protein
MNQGLDFEGKAQALAYRPSMVYVHEDVRWEYKRLIRDLAHEDLPTEQEMNTLGADGWELAGVLSQPDKVFFYFKRLRK